MKFYGIFVVLLLVFHFSEQNELECWSCDDCKVIHPRHMRVEKCEMDMEQLVAASSEESMTAFPEMTTDFMDQDDQMTTVTEPEVGDGDLEMSTQGEDEEPEVQDYMTTMEGEEMEAETTTESMEETTTDFPVRSIVKRNAGPTAYCYKFSYQSEAKRMKRSRGCVRAYNTEHACALVTALSGDNNDGQCDLCTEDKCNNADFKTISFLTVMFGVILSYLRT